MAIVATDAKIMSDAGIRCDRRATRDRFCSNMAHEAAELSPASSITTDVSVSGLIDKALQVAPVGGLVVTGRQPAQVLRSNKSLDVRYLLQAADQQTLAVLNRPHE